MTEEAPQLRKDVVPAEYRQRYKDHGGTTGDLIATELQRVSKDGEPALRAVMAENGIQKNRWAGFNLGQVRMNLSNVLRSALFKGESVTILGKQHNVRHMADEYGLDNIKDTDASIKKFADKHNLLGTSPDRVVKALRKTFFPPADKTAEREAAKAAKAEAAQHKKEAREQEAAKKKQAAADAKAAADKKKADDKAAKDAEKAAAKAAADKKKADDKAAKDAQKAEAKKLADAEKAAAAKAAPAKQTEPA